MAGYVNQPGRRHAPRVSLVTTGQPPSDLTAPSQSATERVAEAVNVNKAVHQELLVHRASDSPLDLMNIINNPNLGAVNVPVVVVSIRVPAGRVLEITALAICYNDPLLHQGNWLSWRLAVNGGRVPNLGMSVGEFNPGGFGRVTRPTPIQSVFVQADSTVTLEVVTFDAAYSAAVPYLVVAGRIQGVLRNVVTKSGGG